MDKLDLDKYKGHTPGSWELGVNGNIWAHKFTGKNRYPRLICEVNDPVHEETAGNLALIADAPMLLAKLQEAVGLLKRHEKIGSGCSYYKCAPDCLTCHTREFLSTIEGK